MKTYYLLGVKVQTLPEVVVKETLQTFLDSDSQHQIATVNAEFIVSARNNEKFLEVINNSSLSTIDGSGPIKALQFLGHPVSLDDRVTGVYLTELLIDLAIKRNKKILFCLYSQGLTRTEQFFMQMKEKYPELDFQIADENNAMDKVLKFQPDIVLVGFGAPRQDFWIAEHLPRMPQVKIAAGVGGTFDFMSGKVKRAPKILRSLGMEWLFRVLQQPFQDLSGTGHRIRRIYRAVVVFPYLILKDRYKQYRNYGKNKN